MSLPSQVAEQQKGLDSYFESVGSDGDNNTSNGESGGSVEPTVDELKAQLAKADQRYRTLQGMLNSANAQHQQALQEMNAKIAELTGALAEANKRETTVQPVEVEQIIRPEDIEEIGPENVSFVKRVVQGVTEPLAGRYQELEKRIEQLQKELVPKVSELASTQMQTSEQVFWDRLAELVPNWREINENPSFQAWLMERDPMMPASRNEMLADAQRSLDARRVSEFFSKWVAETGFGAKASETKSLDQHVTPGRSVAAALPDSGGPVTREQLVAKIQETYARIRDGSIPPEKVADAEHEVFAMMEKLDGMK